MKRPIRVIVIALLLLSILVAGCGKITTQTSTSLPITTTASAITSTTLTGSNTTTSTTAATTTQATLPTSTSTDPLLNYSDSNDHDLRVRRIFIQDKIQNADDGSNVSFGVRWDFLDPDLDDPLVEYIPTSSNQFSDTITGTRVSVRNSR